MRKILGLTVAALLVMGLVGGGTWAYFSDTETSTGNILTAGTLDLNTNNVDGVTGTLTATNIKPGDSIPSGGPATITMKNAGTIAASSLGMSMAFAENDGTEPTDVGLQVDLSANATAAGFKVTTLSYNGTSLLPLTDVNSNGISDLEDLANSVTSLGSGINAGGSADFVIQVQLDPIIADNDFQADGVDTTFTFTLNQ